MGYNNLTELTLTADERHAEAQRIIKMFHDFAMTDSMQTHERKFVEQHEGNEYTSVKQLLWLRDLKSKYVE